MLRVVIDTNIIISSFINPKGPPAKILDLIRDEKIIMVISVAILNEVRDVLLYPKIQKLHGFEKSKVECELQKIGLIADFTGDNINLRLVKDDPDDDKFFECALDGEADYIVSGDHHLLNIEEYQGIEVIKPVDFLEQIENSKKYF